MCENIKVLERRFSIRGTRLPLQWSLYQALLAKLGKAHKTGKPRLIQRTGKEDGGNGYN